METPPPIAGPSNHGQAGEEAIEYLASHRPRRSTAGNRMEAALAEMALEVEPVVEEEDKDFAVAKYEDDIFESDFESTDEEEANSASVDAEKHVREEEKAVRKASHKNVEKQTALAYKRQKATFNPAGNESLGPSKRVRLLPPRSPMEQSPKKVKATRQSIRKSAILNRGETARRVKQNEQKRASTALKKAINKPSDVKALTQAELIQRALDNEEGNITSHRMYLHNEEEKRRKATTVKRQKVEGPLLRWISKVEETEIQVQVPVAAPLAPPVSYAPTYSGQPSDPPTDSTGFFRVPETISSHLSGQNRPYVLQLGPSSLSSQPPSTNSQPQASSSINRPYQPPLPPMPIPYSEIKKINVTRNYLVHELSQPSAEDPDERIAKPSWSETMSAVFGTHVEWDKLKVWGNTRNRPLSRPVRRCPITGHIAPYLDPRTNVPYRDSSVYRVLTEVLNHQYIWSAEGGMYIARADELGTDGGQVTDKTDQEASRGGDNEAVSTQTDGPNSNAMDVVDGDDGMPIAQPDEPATDGRKEQVAERLGLETSQGEDSPTPSAELVRQTSNVLDVSEGGMDIDIARVDELRIDGGQDHATESESLGTLQGGDNETVSAETNVENSCTMDVDQDETGHRS